MPGFIDILAAWLSFCFGYFIGALEGKFYSFREVPFWLTFIKTKILAKRLHITCIVVERIFATPFFTLFFLLITFIFWPKNGSEPFSPYFLLFFAPGFAISSTLLLIKRWKKFKKDFWDKASLK